MGAAESDVPRCRYPLAQLSVQSGLGPGHLLELGRALGALREEGVLILASGSFTHDLSEFRPRRNPVSADEPDWVGAFAEWMARALVGGQACDLTGYRSRAPHAARNHPPDEHLAPLFVALGAGGGRAERLHASVTHDVLRLGTYAFA